MVAAALFPGVAFSGLVVKQGLEEFDQLPTELIVDDGPQISYVYASDRTTRIAVMYDENRRNVPLEEISPLMIDAIIAAEDKNFYQHNGVDIQGIARAFVANTAADQITQGASTITQQFVRLSLTYFSDDLQDVVNATEETTGRKLREARYAIAVEQQLSKDEILNRYLNLAFFGEGAYGVFAASQVYFNKPPSELELHEAAYLAGLVQAPSQYTPTTPEGHQAGLNRRNWVLDQMVDTGAITAEEAAEAKQRDLGAEPRRQPNMCVGVSTNHWGFFCDYFYRWWLEQETFGATPWEREQRLRGGGFQIITTLDVDIQKTVKKHVEAQLPTGHHHALMLAAVEPGTGKVRAMATNRTFALDDPDNPKNGPHSNPVLNEQGRRGSYPNTTNPLISGGGDVKGYQAGSTFKLFTLVAALEEGMPLSTRINSPTRYVSSFPIDPRESSACGNRWCPVNHPGQAPGSYNMWTAFGSSINTYFVQLVERVGPEKAVDVAQRLGIRFLNDSDARFAEAAESWGVFTLGVSGTTPLDLATAYATISAGGIYCAPTPVEEIRTVHGETLDIANPDCRRVLDKDVALAAIDAGRCVTGAGSKLGGCSPGGGTAAGAAGIIGKPVWGKTGTSDGSRTYTLVLSTRQLAIAGQMADPDWAETNQPMDSYKVRDAVIYSLRDAMRGVEAQDWPTPSDPELIRGRMVDIPDVTCNTVAEAEAKLRQAGFQVQIDDQRVDSSCPEGRVAGTNPSGETSPGDLIILQVSNGSDHDDDRGRSSPPERRDNNSGPGSGDRDDQGGGGGGATPPPPSPTPAPPSFTHAPPGTPPGEG